MKTTFFRAIPSLTISLPSWQKAPHEQAPSAQIAVIAAFPVINGNMARSGPLTLGSQPVGGPQRIASADAAVLNMARPASSQSGGLQVCISPLGPAYGPAFWPHLCSISLPSASLGKPFHSPRQTSLEKPQLPASILQLQGNTWMESAVVIISSASESRSTRLLWLK